MLNPRSISGLLKVFFPILLFLTTRNTLGDVVILPLDDLSPTGVTNGSAWVHMREAPNKAAKMAFQAVVPDFADGSAETLDNVTYTWTLNPTTPNVDFINPSGNTTSDSTNFTAAGQPNGTSQQFTLTCEVQGTLSDGTPFDETGSISIMVVWSSITVTSIDVLPVLNSGNVSDTLASFHLTFNETIVGTGLTQCSSCQMIEIDGTELDKNNGTQINPPNFGIVRLGTGNAPGPAFGWTMDWNWGALLNDTVSLTVDDHTFGSPDAHLGSINGVVSGDVPLETTNRNMKIEVEITADNTILAVHYWGYGWDNWNGRWLRSDNPPATAKWIAGGPHWPLVGGEFTDPVGLSGPLPGTAYLP